MLGPAVSLILLSIALAWSVFFRAGVSPAVWDVTLLVVSCVSVLYWLFTRPIHSATPLSPWLRWPIFLLPCYIAFQLIPLPVGLLQVLSPARADLVRALAPVIPGITRAPLSVNPPAAMAGLFTILGYTVTFLLVRELASRFSAHPWIPVVPLIAIAALEGTIGLVQVFTAWPLGHATGTYANPDHFAGLLEMVLPFAALYGLAIMRRRKDRFGSPTLPAVLACGAWAVAAVLLLAIMYSLSRMGFVVTLCALFLVAVLSMGPRLPSRVWRLGSVGLTGVVIAVMLIFFPPDQLIARFAELSSTKNVSANVRLHLWKETLSLISEFRWFGCGLGGFESTFLKYQAIASSLRADFAHNDYLQYLAELGLVGFAILAAILAGIILQILRGVLALSEEDRRLLVIACAGAFLAISLHSLVDFNMHIPANTMTLAWIAGIGSANASD